MRIGLASALLVAVLLAACGGGDNITTAGPNPTTPTPTVNQPVSPFTRSWSGFSTITACDGGGLCHAQDPNTGVGSRWPTYFTFSQSGSNVTGTMRIFDANSLTYNIGGSVSNGSFSGSGVAKDGQGAGPFASIRLTPSSDGNSLSGTWTGLANYGPSGVATATISVH